MPGDPHPEPRGVPPGGTRPHRPARLWGAFAAAMVLLVAAGAASYSAIERYAGAARWVDHTQVVLRELERVELLLKDAESAQRGYIITRDARFLERFREAGPQAEEAVRGLAQLTSDNPDQVRRMAVLGSLATQRIDSLRRVLDLFRARGADAVAPVIATGEGVADSWTIVDTIAAARADEVRLLEQRSAAAFRTGILARRLAVLTGAAGVILVVLAVLVSAALRRSYGRLLSEITRRERATEEVRLLNATLDRRVRDRTRELQDANAQLEAFGYSVSHDLRAPLRAIQGFASALKEECGDRLPATCRGYAERVSAAAHRMDGLIEDLLAYSRLSRTELELRAVPLAAVVREAMGELDEEIRRRGATIRVRDPLPSARGQRMILVQIVANLLSNAMKFVGRGIAPEVDIWAEHTGETVRLSVRDNGIGIEPEYHGRIFRVFERLHAAEEYPGTGIGLATVRRGAERLGGRVGVDSAPGSGSTFWIDLPAEGPERTGQAGAPGLRRAEAGS